MNANWFHWNILIWQGVAANWLNDAVENDDFVKRLGKAFDSLTVRSEESEFKSQHKSYPAKFLGDRIKTQHCSSAAVAALNRQCYWYHKNLSVSAQRLQQGEKIPRRDWTRVQKRWCYSPMATLYAGFLKGAWYGRYDFSFIFDINVQSGGRD